MSNCNDCQVDYKDYFSEELYTWCTNCGNYGIHASVKRALVAEGISPKDVVFCFDVGCNGNGSDKIGGYAFHGLHGRVLPLASGVALANKRLKVIAFGGDGATLSEGINHLIHSVRNNYDFTFILHDNSNYGLTTGQASSTTPQDIPMNSSPDGVSAQTLNPTNLVLELNPSFVARGFSGDVKHLTELVRKAINHKGFSYLEILQSCPSYNKTTPHEWYLEHTFNVDLDRNYMFSDINAAREISRNRFDNIALGVLFQNKNLMEFSERLVNRQNLVTELVDEVYNYEVEDYLKSFR